MADNPPDIKEDPFTRGEIDAAIKATAKGKAPGVDGIPAEFWAELGEGRAVLLDIINICWVEETFPAQWKEAMVVGIFKKRAEPMTRPTTALSPYY